MCLKLALERPDDVLAKGNHLGFEWMIIHNGRGYRCGYVRVSKDHPWYGKGYDEVNASVHGGLTFAAYDEVCDKGGPDDGYWVGFDCAHGGDAPDPELASTNPDDKAFRDFMNQYFDANPLNLPFYQENSRFRNVVRTQEYVEDQCKSLCEQALKESKNVRE